MNYSHALLDTPLWSFVVGAHFFPLFALGVSLGPASIALCASEDASPLTDLETIVVTGSRLDIPANQFPGAISIITRDMIEKRSDEHLLDLLRSVPGLHVDQAGGRGGIASVHVRGGEAKLSASRLCVVRNHRCMDLTA